MNYWRGWQNVKMAGNYRAKRKNPPRHLFSTRQAVERIGCRYKEQVIFFNPLFKGKRFNLEAGLTSLDFALFYRSRMRVILLDIERKEGGTTESKRRRFQAKKDFLTQKGIPYLVLSRFDLSVMEREFLIRRFLEGGAPNRHATRK